MTGPLVLGLRILMAGALYGFLGLAVYILWQSTVQQGTLLASRMIPSIQLSFVEQDRFPSVKSFRQPEILIGRDRSCDIRLNEDTVSARHSQLAYHHGQWWITDLASTNGTFLNGLLIQTSTVLAKGDELRCGKSVMQINFPGQSSPPGAEGMDR
ncbi:MAG: FHA domain-containing protein [Chloroflexi bacterium]|nr:FHA domain-containing protein [Chloroflexota bacterium]